MPFSMRIGYVTLIAFTIVSSMAVAMGRSIPGSTKVAGGFDIANSAGADIKTWCLALGDSGYVRNLGLITLKSGSKWGTKVDHPATSIKCAFGLVGKKDLDQSMWETNFSSVYDLPVRCVECHWAVDEKGFSLVNPHNLKSIPVADWIPE